MIDGVSVVTRRVSTNCECRWNCCWYGWYNTGGANSHEGADENLEERIDLVRRGKKTYEDLGHHFVWRFRLELSC
ncbi:hypothetical protein V1478_008991 [Vespula squamosa]|uniref:Uncharacterized protein n=1 Tax=Vespula squamosa TaxID=30214 RepID=A0ABD2AV60_VESSQ